MNSPLCRGTALACPPQISRVTRMLVLGLVWFAGAALAKAQSAPAALSSLARPAVRIAGKVDNANRVTLAGNTHPLARPENDRGAVDPGSPMRRMILTLSHSDAQESALAALLSQQQDKGSALFHQWLTPAQYGAQFGASDADIATITDWLRSQGFTIGSVANGRNAIEFSGTAGQVTAAFQTPIHQYEIDGVMYQANSRDPSIPVALAPVVRGVLSLHNFGRRAHNRNVGLFQRNMATGAVTKLSGPTALTATTPVSGGAAKPNVAKANPQFTYADNGTNYALGPYDFATIYNLLPLWNAGIDGTGQSIAILQETNIHIDDVRAFRSFFGLPANDPVVILNGPDPGVTVYDEGEADIDVQWSGAVAKGAKILLIASASTETTAGTDLSAEYAIDNNVAPITSLSYGECELGLGTSGNAFYNVLWQQGAAQGISHFVSTGDSGAASCDDGSTTAAKYGLSVSGMASTPYETAVGGTDFLGSLLNSSNYWNSTNANTTNASAIQYIPETTWNDTCTNPIFQSGFESSPYASAEAACAALGSTYREAVGGSGGVSACTTSSGTVASCSGGYAKPSWQTGTGVPADGKRDIPDVSVMASNGFFGSFYVICQEDQDTDGKSCNFNSPYADFAGYGGTSVSTPAFAGIMALVNQKTNARQGIANYVLYQLYNQQTTAGTACTSSFTGISGSSGTAETPASSCVFNDITYGTNSMACTKGDPNCYTASGYTYGILSTSTTSFNEAYNNGVGYDLAVGLGSVNANNLVNSWANVTFAATNTTLGLSSTNFAHGTSVNATIGVTPASGSGVPTGNVELVTDTTPTSLGYVGLSNGSVVGAYSNLPGGTYTVSAYYGGDGTYAPSTSSPVAVTVTAETSKLTGGAFLENESTGAVSSITTAPYGAQIFIAMTAAGVSGKGIPTGTVAFKNNGSAFGTFAVNTTGEAADVTAILAPGSYSFTGTYSGDNSFNGSSTTAATALTITQATTTTKLVRSPTGTLAAGAALTLTGTVVGSTSQANGGDLGAAPTGTVSFYSGGTSGTLLGTVPFASTSTNQNTGAISSIASLVTTGLPYSTTSATVDSLTAVYSGDTNYATSTSSATSETVARATKTATTSALSATNLPLSYGTSTMLTSTLSYTSPNTPTGTISFYVDGVISGSGVTVSGGSASTTVAGLSGGFDTVTAVYSGDTNFLGSTGVLTTTVSPASTAMTLTPSATSATQGTILTFTGAIPYTAPAEPTGSMTFSVDGVPTGTAMAVYPFAAGGVGAYFNSSTLLPGTHTIGASYTGDKNYNGSNAITTVTITAAPSLLLSVVQRTAIVLGAPVTVNVQAKTLSSGPIPTGSFTYTVDGGAASSPAGLTLGAASFVLTGLSELQHTVAVTYSGDSTYTSTSQSIVLNGDVAQSILFFGLANRTYSVAPKLALTARATSGLPVSYAVTGPATINGSILTLTGTGTVTVTASQPGNSSFAAATSVTRSFVAQ